MNNVKNTVSNNPTETVAVLKYKHKDQSKSQRITRIKNQVSKTGQLYTSLRKWHTLGTHRQQV